MSLKIDSAILKALSLNEHAMLMRSHGSSGFSSTFKLSTIAGDGVQKLYFVKSGRGRLSGIVFAGEHPSLNAIHDAVPSLCPPSYGHGPMADTSDEYFLVTGFLDLSISFQLSDSPSGDGSGLSLAQKLVKLHSTPAPIPKGHHEPMFGFPIPTCCGDTIQSNTYTSTWAEFFGKHRLLAVLSAGEKKHGVETALSAQIERTISIVIPALLAEGHLTTPSGGKILPVVVHGDLWSGNHGIGSMDGSGVEEMMFDPSCSYSHSEFEFGIMRMFGGFGPKFEQEYFELKNGGKDKPVEEWDDRLRLYELYHHLNHYVLFGGSYKSSAMRIMTELIDKYGP